MAIIKVMDEILANKIAAGEVVERCASVVKELVENSIDAESTEIKVELIEAGTKEIKVTDNGKGMDKEDAVTAFSRHATSKLLDEDDLFRINTLGFRGEALASIASVSDTYLKTSTGSIGTEVHIKGGKIETVTPSEARKGSIMCVKDLFYNTPARLKHMKSLYTELASITEYMNKLALSYPDIKFSLINNTNTLLNTDGSGNLLKTIKNIYGIEVARKMLEVSISDDDYEISGYISLPEIHRSSRNNMITIVNGRVVKNVELNKAINDSYHSYKPDNRYPITVLNIEVDPSLIDVNIHPTKMDIKFSKLEELKKLVTQLITTNINNRNLIPHIEISKKEEVIKEKVQYDYQTLNLNRVEEATESYQESNIETSKPSKKIDNKTVKIFEKEPISEKEPNNLEIEKENNQDYHQDIIETKKERLPELYPVGLVHGTYIICQNELGMYMIDQHAAKERINYEMYKKKMGTPETNSTPFLFPLTIELSNSEMIILKQNFELLRSLKFEIEEFGISSIIIKSHPTWLPSGYEDDSIRKIIEIIIHQEKNFSIEKFNEKVATMLSCKMAIKANMNITMEEMEHLITDLRNCDNPFNCPHGRPTTIFYSKYDLEKLFKRSGFDTKA